MTNPLVNQNPNNHHPGKKSLSKRALFIIVSVVVLIVLLILMVIASKGEQAQVSQKKSSASTPISTTKKHNNADGTPPSDITQTMKKKTLIAATVKEPTLPPPTNTSPQAPVLTLAQQRKQAYEQQIEDYRQQQRLAAMGSSTVVPFELKAQPSKAEINPELAAISTQTSLMSQRLAKMQPNGGRSESKEASEAPSSPMHLAHSVNSIVSQYELNVGSVIPAILITGINSALPGQVIASVSQNVYDSATGKYLLIPQGAKLYGVYKSQVSYGQERVLLAWTRINFPNGSTLDLDAMAGIDKEGYAGFKDGVDNHYWKIFGNALLLGLISGGTQAGVSDNTDKTAPSKVADGVTQQFAQTGSSLVQKNLDVQPQITIRNGYRFNVMVNKDVTLKPYIDHAY